MIAGLRALASPPDITVAEIDPARRAALAAGGVRAVPDAASAVAAGDVVVLATKPQSAAGVLPEIAAAWAPGKLLVSVLAGTPTRVLEAGLPAGAAVVRAMPNTPLAIGRGMVGLAAGCAASAADMAEAEALFAPCARVLRVRDEALMDAVTAVSGSGPACVRAVCVCVCVCVRVCVRVCVCVCVCVWGGGGRCVCC